MRKILRIILIISLLTLIFRFDFNIPKARAQEIHLTQCGTLSQANTNYILDNDVLSAGTCFTITAGGVTLDLNGHTVTYDNFANTGLPNPGFENGNGEVPADWDLSKAPSAKRRPTSEKPLPEKWYLKFTAPNDGEEIVSSWTNLPASAKAMPHFIRADAIWAYPNCLTEPRTADCQAPVINLSVEFEDGSIVFSGNYGNAFYNAYEGPIMPVFDTKSNLGKYRIHFKIDKGFGQNVSIDQLDLRPGGSMIPATGNYGVLVNSSKASIKNGRIIQGQAKGPLNDNIHIYSGEIEVSGMHLEASGLEAANVWADYVGGRVVNSTLVSNSLYRLGSRHQLRAALMFLNGRSGVVISGNNISSGPGWGCVYLHSTNGIASNNYCFTKTTITNHHGIAFGGNGAKVFNNTVVADPGQGIAVASSEVEIFNNIIYLKSQAPNVEYGRLGLEAITLKDWNSRLCRNTKVHDNKIFLTGDFDDYFGAGGQPVVGILNGATGKVEFYNNYIKVDVIDNKSLGTGVVLGGEFLDEATIWRNNIIESNHRNVLFGGHGSYAPNVRSVTFESNTLIKGANPLPDYSTLSIIRYPQIENTRLIDTKLVNGATLDIKNLGMSSKYDYYVDWYLDVMVKDNSDTPIEGATVEVKDVNGTVVFSGTNDANGRANNISLNQYRNYGGWGDQPKGKAYSTPHTLNISKTGYQTETKTLTMDASKEMTVILDGQDVEPPVLSNIAVSDLTQNSATVSWQTDKEADSKVEYGLDTNYGTTLTDTNMTTGHAINLINLTPNTYHFRVTSKDSSGKENVGVDHTFFILSTTPQNAILTKSVDKSSGQSGETLTYTITYTISTQSITNAKIEDPIPSGTTYIENSATNEGIFNNNKLIWNLGNLISGASGQVQFKVKIE